MSSIQQLLTDNLAIWTAAENGKKSGRGRSSSNGDSIHGIKKLRELILELAVRGKLVPQDLNDEPASELIKRIQAEKVRLMAKGKMKKEKQLTPISEDEKFFELPQGWEWSKLGYLSEVKGGKRLPAGTAFSNTETPYVYIQVTNMKNGTIVDDNLKYIDENTRALINQYTISSNDLYITIAGTIGDVGSVPERFSGMNLTENAAKIVFRLLDKKWLKLTLRSSLALKQFLGKTNTLAQPKLALHRIADSVFSIPPLAEQKRIVAKVDELMALCDQMETQQSNAAEAHEKLVNHLLGTLTQSQSAEEFSENWLRIAAHFDTLFTTEDSIDVLKLTILQLGVMGKLVPQDPSDESASELLECIQAEKTKLIAMGKIKKEKPLPSITENEKPFELPKRWAWTRLGELIIVGPNNGYSPKPSNTPTGYRCLTLSATTKGFFNSDCFKYVDIDKSTAEQFFLKKDDLLIQRANSIDYVGIPAIYDDKNDLFIYPDLMMRMRISEKINLRYLHFFLISEYGRSYFKKNATGTQGNMPKINQGTVVNCFISLPPFAEQCRIVSKIDELLKVCGQIRLLITESNQLQQKLADLMIDTTTSMSPQEN